MKNLISDYKNLHTEQKTLQKKQTAFLALAQAADEQLQAYTRMQRAFLDAQAGILAGSLQAGIPCPVCGSVEHPRPAVLSEHAPTEEQVKCAKPHMTMRKPPLPPQAKPPQRKKQKWKKRQTLCAGLWKRCCQVFPKSSRIRRAGAAADR